MKELVDTANANHVKFTFALSPANDICYTSQTDFKATIAKFEQLRSLGVTSFYVALDDIPLTFHCDSDRQKYPNLGNWHWLADAQADYLNRIQTEYIEPNGLPALQTVPTNYAGSAEDPYKGEFGDRLNKSIRVQWTGEGVFSDTITSASVTKASTSYRTDHLFIWDSFPVNDGRRGRLFLNPLTGRDPQLYQHLDGFTSNPMIQPYASLPALANYADYTWNGPAYDPDASMAAALRELAGPSSSVQQALNAFADLNQNWPYRDAVVNAPALNADITRFWAAHQVGNFTGTRALRERLTLITQIPQRLTGMAQPGFAADIEPWSQAAAHWATASQHLIAMLDALKRNDGVRAANEFALAQQAITLAKRPTVDDQAADGTRLTDVIVPSVGDGAFEAFSAKATQVYLSWLGATPMSIASYPATASSSMGTWETNTAAKMVDGNLATLYWSNAAPAAGAWVQVDLGSVKPVGSVAVHQSSSDTETGDMIYNAALEYSVDGSTWTTAASFATQPLISYTFDQPVQARYVRVRATAPNAGGQWVKVREFEVHGVSAEYASNLAAAPSSGVAKAFDADPATAYVAASSPVSGSYLARNFDPAASVGSVQVLGSADAQVQINRGGVWTTIGSTKAATPYTRIAVPAGAPVSGVRLLFTPGSAAPTIYELIVR